MNELSNPAMTTHHITTLSDLRTLCGPAGERSLKKEMSSLDTHATRFIELSPFMVLASSEAQGHMGASPRGGAPGFVKVLDASRHTARSKLSPMGEMLRDQIQAFKGETIEIETQAEMVQRYHQSL